jgi:hypothetical protein
MSELDRNAKQTIRERAYYIWEREARPEGRTEDHWAVRDQRGPQMRRRFHYAAASGGSG